MADLSVIGPTRAAFGYTTGNVYRAWAKAARVAPISDDVGEGAHLHWVGEKKTDKVLFWFHGTLPAACSSLSALIPWL
jgi:hypothetical protein